MTEQTFSGFAMGYAKGKGEARVYVAFALAALFGGFWITNRNEIALLFAILAFGVGFYFYPLVEADRPRIGAGEHGIFIEGFGLIPWRSVQEISLSRSAVRSIEVCELHITLSRGLPGALAADWRSVPFYKRLMKLPWRVGRSDVVRINLEPFPGSPEEIIEAFRRRWRYFGR